MEHFFLKKILHTSSSSSTSSCDSDLSTLEIILIKRKRKTHTKNQNYIDFVALNYSPDDFKSHFRLSREAVENFLLENNFGDLSVSQGRPKIPVLNCLLLTLWLLANQESFRSAGDRFCFSKGHAHTIFIQMCKLISSRAKKYIKWPSGNEAFRNIQNFNKLRGESSFPNVFGCIDGSHIAIPGPLADNSYYNRKGFHSIQLQAICNSKQEFIDVFTGWPGSVHDSRVWQNSPIYNKILQNRIEMLPNSSYLLGDSAYPLDTFLMTPFRDNGNLTRQQKLFNLRLSSVRVVIEQCFGRLKGIFRRLRYLPILNLSYAKLIIFSACIFHNIIIQNNEDIIEDFEFEMEELENENLVDRHPVNNEAEQIRRNIMQTLL